MITTKGVMFHSRGFRGGRRRSSPRPIVKTYKKVLNFAEASFAAGLRAETFVTGVDSVAIGQTSLTDANVPTGARIKFIEIQMPITNAVDQTAYINCSLQYKLSGQALADPDGVGGHPQRNQVLHQELFQVGFNQNSTHKFKLRIPKQFQRLREGMVWILAWSNSNTVNRRLQVIYKVEL